jgi:PhzF family phenazine biosynthesis protein
VNHFFRKFTALYAWTHIKEKIAMASYKFKQVDVFTNQPFYGNPVAVILDAQNLAASDMQRIAAWTNLSETTFLLPPSSSDADYRLRIFTPKGELPFAGHPTVGSAHAALEAGIVKATASQLVQECSAGLLNLRIEGDRSDRRIFVQTPKPEISQIQDANRRQVAAALGTDILQDNPPLLINVGPIWCVVNLGTADIVHALQPDMVAIDQLSQELNMAGVTVFGRSSTGRCAIYVRSFAPACGVPEDPVCGSGNASVAAYIAHTGMPEGMGNTYVANQGLEMGRNGYVQVRIGKPDLTIEIGGASVTCIEGSLRM